MSRRVGAGIAVLALALLVVVPGTAAAGGVWGGGKRPAAVGESIIWGGGHTLKPQGLVWGGGGNRAGWTVMLSAVLAGLRSRYF